MFGIDLWNATLAPALAVAAAAGVLSFLSPCVLPIVPPYLAFMAGASMREAGARNDGRLIKAAAFFVLGLSTVFLLLGLAASALGLPLLGREARFAAHAETGTALGAYVFGLAFAFGWTPCIGPVLGAILALAAQSGSTERGMLLMAAYAFGLGLPFLLTALFLGRALRLMAGLRRHMGTIERVMGVLLVAVGLMMLTGAFSDFSFWLLETFP